MRTEVPQDARGAEDDSRELCFPRKCPPSSRVRVDAVFLPHSSSPLPVPLRVLVPGWCFLVAAAAVSMCVADPARPAPGGPPLALRLARRAVGLARVSSPPPRSPSVPPPWRGARSVIPQGGSADRLGCPLSPLSGHSPRVVVRKGLGASGLGGGGGSLCFTSATPRSCLSIGEADR